MPSEPKPESLTSPTDVQTEVERLLFVLHDPAVKAAAPVSVRDCLDAFERAGGLPALKRACALDPGDVAALRADAAWLRDCATTEVGRVPLSIRARLRVLADRLDRAGSRRFSP